MLQIVGLEVQSNKGDMDDIRTCKNLFERAVKSHPTNLTVWMTYAHFEHLRGNNHMKVYKRAVQMLESQDVHKFIDYCNSFK